MIGVIYICRTIPFCIKVSFGAIENMNSNNVEVAILVNGKPVKFYGVNGKTFIAANFGAEYEIRIKNNNYYRVMAVASVDGLSVLDGKPADKDGVGYVLNSYSSVSIKGFRSDNNTVGAFKFTKKKKGYAKEVTGSSENSGIIAVAVFGEKLYTPAWTYNPSTVFLNTCNELPRGGISYTNTNLDNGLNSVIATTTKANCSATYTSCNNITLTSNCAGGAGTQNALRSFSPQKVAEEVPNFAAATTWGKKIDDRVTTTTFEKGSAYPMAEFSIYYDIRENLEKIGIVFEHEKQIAYPKAFPNGFATPPVGWNS